MKLQWVLFVSLKNNLEHVVMVIKKDDQKCMYTYM